MGCNRCGRSRRVTKRAASARGKPARAAEIKKAANETARIDELRKKGVRPTAPRAVHGNVRAVPYTIMRGDTMADIGRRFGMTTQEIAKYDGGTGVANLARIRSRNIHVLLPGEIILVPKKGG